MQTMDDKNAFDILSSINVSQYIETKNGLSYVSWSWAWYFVKKNFPDAFFTIYEGQNGCLYHTDGKTAWVKTGVTINAIEHIEYLPVMNNRNASITIEQITSVDANKAIQRSLTKACARHGLGLSIYAGEDSPLIEVENKNLRKKAASEASIKAELCIILSRIESATSRAEIYSIYNMYIKKYEDNEQFINAISIASKKYPKAS